MSALVDAIFAHQHIGYCLLSARGEVCEVGGNVAWLPPAQRPYIGKAVQEFFPELIGYESAFEDVRNGTLPALELPYINREREQGDMLYLTLKLVPAPDNTAPLLLIVADVSEVGALEQLITQHRNEIRLLHALEKRQHVELQTLNRHLMRLAEIKSMFVTIAAHEFRTPLTSLLGYLELLANSADSLSAQQREYIAILEQTAHHLVNLTQTLLDVNRLETEQLELQLESCNLELLITEAVTRFAPLYDAKHQTLSVHLPPNLPPVLCDPARIRQVLDNLLANAHKYTPEGSQVSITLESVSPGIIACHVQDNGPGLKANDQELLFTPFYRGEQARKSGQNGMGLGLYIARSIIELHGGTLTCQSDPGKGTRFTFTLPVLDET